MKNRFLIANDQGMTRIVPPLKTNNCLRSIRQKIDDFPLAFVAPLCTNDSEDAHESVPPALIIVA